MSKGAYSFIAYPESANIEEITQVLSSMGAQWCYILHDKDMSGDQPKKPHWHIIAGWQRQFPLWDRFADMCDSVKAVALSPTACRVRDISKVEEYLVHKNAPHKYQYPAGEVHRSKRWAPELYQTEEEKRDEKRKQRRTEDAGELSEIFGYIRDRKIFNFSTLLDQLAAENPALFVRAVEKAYAIQSYISGCNTKLDYEVEIADLQDTIRTLSEDARLVASELSFAARALVEVHSIVTQDCNSHYWECDLEKLVEWANKKHFEFSKYCTGPEKS